MRRSPDDFEGHFLVCIENPGSFRARRRAARRGRPVAGDARRRPRRRSARRPTTGIAALRGVLCRRPAVGQLIARCERLSEVDDLPLPVEPAAALREGARPAPRARHARRRVEQLRPDLRAGDDVVGAPGGGARRGRGARRASASADLPKRFHRKAARIIDAPWRIAVGGDFGHPATVGPRPLGTAQLNGYMQRVVRAAHASVPVARSFNRVLQLDDPPTALLAPADGRCGCCASPRRSPVATGAPVATRRWARPGRLSARSLTVAGAWSSTRSPLL